jgi:WD40 repeat protein/tetratricopeptide (TPR) repeat protein
VLGSERIEGRAPGYAFRAAPEEIDAHRFEALLREARDEGLEPKAALDLLDEALELWRGPTLADLSSEPSLLGEIARLEELRLVATEERNAARLDLGRHAEVVAELEAAAAAHPLRERLWGQLVLALYRSGRQAEALAAFDRARQLLADELGIDPSRELQDLHERVLRQDESLELTGEPLRGYRLLEKIGEGAFGSVYRAIQPQVEREVAIKSIHPELANQPDFVRRFEREAQVVARLEHPHIVPLYDFWREPDGAFLIMRLLRGGSLEDELRAGPLDPMRVGDILDQVGGALSAAHRQGLVHRDVKPGNVLLDEAGNAYLSDFGIALETGAAERTAGTMIRGTPAYLSPEQIRLEPTTPRSDVYAIGVLLFEMLTSEHPFRGTSLNDLLDRHLHHPMPPVRGRRPEIPAAVDGVIARATAKDPDARFFDVLEVGAAYRAAIEGRERSVAAGEVRNPYKGLRAFLEPDSADFFGRELLTRRLVERLAEPGAARFLCVVGPSGAGKSSVVRAGLVPAIRRGAIPGSERWYVVDLLPGARPLRELERALLGVGVNPPPSLLDELEQDELGLTRAVTRLLPDPDAELLIVVDQLEELFTMTAEDERVHVLASLRAAASDPGGRTRIVATLRADLFDQPLSVRGFGELLAARNEAITPMSPEELERAIVGPAERVGLDVEPGLVAAMVADVIDRPGALPLLQYALTELADRKDVTALTLAAYRRIGGVSGALARRAEHLFDALDDDGRAACRQLFLRLVTLGEGSEDTRRRVRRSELGVPATDEVIEAFGRHRLLSFDRDPVTREPTVEIAHEALLNAWSRLGGWIDEARDDLRTRGALAAAASGWSVSGRDVSFLLRGGRLEQLASWAGTSSVELSAEERGFLEASLLRRAEEEVREEHRRQRELALERRSVKRLRALVAVLTASVLVAGTLTAIAVNRNAEAARASRIATARELAAAAAANLPVDRELATLLALESVRVNDGVALPEAEEILRRTGAVAATDTSSVLGGVILEVDFAPAGDAVALAGGDNSVGVWDLSTGQRKFLDTSLAACDTETCPDVLHLSMSDDGTTLATMAYPLTPKGYNSFHVWDLAEGGDTPFTVAPTRGLWDQGFVALSPDGGSLATAEWETLRIYPVGVERPSRTVRWRHSTPEIVFSPDGSHLFLGDEDPWPDLGPTLVDVSTGETQVLFPGHPTDVPSFSADGSRLALYHFDPAVGGRLSVVDVASGSEIATTGSHGGPVALSPDGTVVAATSAVPNLDDPSVVTLLDADTLEPIRSLRGDTAWVVRGIAFDPTSSQIATASGTVNVWDVRTGEPTFTPPVEASSVVAFEFTEDGSRIAVVYVDGRIIVYPIALDDAIEIARSRVTRSLTDEECRTYLHVPTCPSD